jgi:uncharacterized protein DUF1876
MSAVDVWTVSIVLRAEGGRTRADASLQGRAVEVECSGAAGRPGRPTTPAFDEDLAAARGLRGLSRCLTDWGGSEGVGERTDDGA